MQKITWLRNFCQLTFANAGEGRLSELSSFDYSCLPLGSRFSLQTNVGFAQNWTHRMHILDLREGR